MAIDFPESLSLKQLESSSDTYQALSPEWERISLFYSGGYALRLTAEQFLKPRIGEETVLYQERLSKFTYKNIFSAAIKLQASRMSNSPISVTTEAADEEWWSAFRENTNQKGRTEKRLATEIFRELLKFKTIWLHVDRPASDVAPLNRAQEMRLGLDPYINIYSPLEVINWDDQDDFTWVKLRQSYKESDPFGTSRDVVTWTFITDREIAKYSAYVEMKNGKLLGYYNASGELITDSDQPGILLVSDPVVHGLGAIPVVKAELPDDLWVGDEASLLAYRHLRESCHAFDLLTSGYFQRYYDTQALPDSDYSSTAVDDEPPQLGTAYVPKLSKFEWSEPQGYLIAHLFTSLENTANDIKETIALVGASASPATTVVEQSGESKEMDYVMSNEMLGQYGSVVADALQDAYQLVQRYRGRPAESVAVSGLSNFEVDSFDKLISRLAGLGSIDLEALRSKIPPSLYDLVQERITDGLIGNMTPEQKQQVLEELREQETPADSLPS